MDKESLKQPMRATSVDFERVQSILQYEFSEWSDQHKEFVNKWSNIYREEHLDQDNPVLVTAQNARNYDDVEYEMFIWESFNQQLTMKRKALVQLRLLQMTNPDARAQYYIDNPGDKHPGEILMVHNNRYYEAIPHKIKF
jgi:hypothetical protein